jgi:hypothetical protein
MNELQEGTPISMIQESDLKWEISYKIYPIGLQYAERLSWLIEGDDLFTDVDVKLVSVGGRISSIVLSSDGLMVDPCSMSPEFERRLNDLMDSFLQVNGGYFAAQA